MLTRFKYYLSCPLLLGCIVVNAQQSNLGNQSIVTIVGDPVQSNNTNDFVNSDNNPYTDNNNEPPVQQQTANISKNIEPTLENGFHMRFELDSPESVDRMSSVSSSAGGSSFSSSSKSHKRAVTMTERAFNIKKKMRAKLPHRKKKYHPHLCGRF